MEKQTFRRKAGAAVRAIYQTLLSYSPLLVLQMIAMALFWLLLLAGRGGA